MTVFPYLHWGALDWKQDDRFAPFELRSARLYASRMIIPPHLTPECSTESQRAEYLASTCRWPGGTTCLAKKTNTSQALEQPIMVVVT